MPKWTEIWWEVPMEGSVLSFIKAELKVSDTGSAHWASSCQHFRCVRNCIFAYGLLRACLLSFWRRNFLLKFFSWRVSKSFWWLHLIWILDGVNFVLISFKYICSNSVVYWATRSKWGLLITSPFQAQKRNGFEL